MREGTMVPTQNLTSQLRQYGADCKGCTRLESCDKVGGGEPAHWPVVKDALRARTKQKEAGPAISTIRFVRGVAALSIEVFAIFLRRTGGRRGV